MTPTQEFFERQIRAWNDNNVIGNYDYKPLMDRHVHEIAAHLYGNLAQVEVGLVHELAEALREGINMILAVGDTHYHDTVIPGGPAECDWESCPIIFQMKAALARVEERSQRQAMTQPRARSKTDDA